MVLVYCCGPRVVFDVHFFSTVVGILTCNLTSLFKNLSNTRVQTNWYKLHESDTKSIPAQNFAVSLAVVTMKNRLVFRNLVLRRGTSCTCFMPQYESCFSSRYMELPAQSPITTSGRRSADLEGLCRLCAWYGIFGFCCQPIISAHLQWFYRIVKFVMRLSIGWWNRLSIYFYQMNVLITKRWLGMNDYSIFNLAWTELSWNYSYTLSKGITKKPLAMAILQLQRNLEGR